MNNRIHKLDEETIQQIAAGEVVERPASVVKELVENSLDAGATSIDVIVKKGGKETIRVVDNGRGMTAEEVSESVKKHTTSKISSIDDLAEGIQSLGFRGEALHTIAAVSKLTITSAPDNQSRGTKLEIDGGDRVDRHPTGHPQGTTVEVKDLFYNVPARKKYLKSESTEFNHINRIVSRYALANPDVAFSLQHNDNEVFQTVGDANVQSALLSVFGREVTESMIELTANVDHADITISGYISDPETTRSTREYLISFINDRYVDATVIREGIIAGYGDQLGSDRYPFAVLFIEMPPSLVDINVHPRKLEVRFSDEITMKQTVEQAVRQTLIDDGLIRKSAPRGSSQKPETQIEQTTINDSPPENDNNTPQQKSEVRADTHNETSQVSSTDSTTNSSIEETDKSNHPSPEPNISETSLQLGTGGPVSLTLDTLPSMNIYSQLNDTYIVAETNNGLILIDQHAADERINYERLQNELQYQPDTQRLVTAVEIEITPQESILFEDIATELGQTGFEITQNQNKISVTGVPAVFSDTIDPELLKDILADSLHRVDTANKTVDEAINDILADLACYPSITGNSTLTDGTIVDLIETLDTCNNPYSCPHGRPVIIEISFDEIESRFERDYPGHP